MSRVQTGAGGRANYWSYLPLVMPTGSAEALWQFDGTANNLVDRTGNGHALTKTAGTERYVYNDGLVGMAFQGTTYYTAALSAGLRLLGALTIEAQWQWSASLPASATPVQALIRCAGNSASELEAENFLYYLTVSSAPTLYTYFCEWGAGTNVSVTLEVPPTAGAIELVTLTRGATGDVNLYQNGTLLDTHAGTHLPSGGGNATTVIGYDLTSAYLVGAIYSMRVSAVELSATQVLDVYEAIAPG